MSHSYVLFGIPIHSEFRLPELAEVPAAPRATLSISRGRVDPDLAGAIYGNRHFQMCGGDIKLSIPGVARFHVRDGVMIVVDPDPAATDKQIQLFLLGTAMGMACLQRGLLPLHANAIAMEGRAVGFAGASGVGKSTLAAHYLRHGDGVLADDICAVDLVGEDAVPIVHPGISRIRLWKQSLHLLEEGAGPLEPVHPGIDKFSWANPGRTEPMPLSALYILSRSDGEETMSVRRLHGGEAIRCLIEQTYRHDLLQTVPNYHFRIDQAFALAARVPVFAVCWPHDFAGLQANARQLREHALGQVACAT